MSGTDHREYTFFILSSSTDENVCKRTIESLPKFGIEHFSYTNNTNSMTAYMCISEGEDYDLDEKIKQLREIPDVIDVQVKSNRMVTRASYEEITISDSVTAIITRFKQADNIRVEEISIDNHSSIQISAGDNATVVINQNVCFKYDDKTYSKIPSEKVLEEIERLKQKMKENNTLDENDRESAIILIDKIKLNLTKVTTFVDKHKESLKWVIPNSTVLFAIINEIIEIMNKN